jgi:hypothetical protein
MKNLLYALKRCVHDRNWYGAITIALTLPDICGSIDSPGKNNSEKRSVAWFDRYVGHAYMIEVNGVKAVFMTGRDCYALRCAALHQGTFDVSDQRARDVVDRFILHHSELMPIHKVRLDKKLVVDITTFCLDIAAGVEAWEAEVMLDDDNRRRSRIASLLPLHLPDVSYGGLTFTKVDTLFK